ncbi:SDR family NAD(P)-dependent oxidoreductase [Pedobacter sp. D749]|uniref:SDR family NAD(P)-dependent oxidoreductase n=1 Tax=Pedobacter sp. D749 TaxID=2856523 RepID=UPI001C5753BD|nr:SDR family NAD(P)-dependent oxidoreductase [Pedobacter sp. D749]QXU43271.1 SDR family NAD(P)-dependent oxidoreductase [Pedobacter sp. D749]
MDIAIIGISCRVPEAESPDVFYQNLAAGKDSVRVFSKKRLRSTTIADDENYQLNGFIEDIDFFDHEFFGISLGEAQQMSPQHRMMLEVAYETIENSGYSIDYFDGSNTSVFIAASGIDYYLHAEKFDPMLTTGNLSAIVAGRISRFFNFRGNSVVIDTSCSSSLTAVHHACNDLILGESSCALVGGVSLNLFPPVINDQYDMGISSADGKAKAFSAEANGTVPGEAVCCLLLKPLVEAIKSGDIIHAVIKSTAVNQDANRSGSLTAPSSTAQAEVIQKAWEKAKIDPSTITYIEAHGTGTKLGDPIEIQGIDSAFRKHTDKIGFCAVSSVKTNIGHTDCAAGIVGLLKATLSLKYKVLLPSLHFNSPNPFINFENSSVYVNTTLKNWDVGKTGVRRAGVSSFGLSGTNCHVVLEEYDGGLKVLPSQTNKSELFVFSARTERALRRIIKRFSDKLIDTPGLFLNDLAYTLAVGKKHFNCRLSFVVKDRTSLLKVLEDFSASNEVFHWKIDVATVAVFSPDLNISEKFIATYSNRYAIFRDSMEECEKAYGENRQTEEFRKFAFQYSFYKLLLSLGVKAKYLIGVGIGQYVVEVISGRQLLTEVLPAILIDSLDHSDIEGRCKKILEKFESQSVVFIEIGKLGLISKQLQSLIERNPDVEVTALKAAMDEDGLNDYISELYRFGFDIDWGCYYSGSTARRVEVPVYPFERVRCWIREALPTRVHNWFHELVWDAAEAKGFTGVTGNSYVIIMDELGLGLGLISALRLAGNECITVSRGKRYEMESAGAYIIDPEEESCYEQLYEDLRTMTKLTGIIDLSGYRKVEAGTEAQAVKYLYSQVYLAKYFSGHLCRKGFEYVQVSSNGYRIGTGDDPVLAIHTAGSCFLKGVLSEYTGLKARGIDVDIYTEHVSDAIGYVFKELGTEDNIKFVGYRLGKRYVQQFKKVAAPELHQSSVPVIRSGGVYLVTGGASGIGLEISKSLSRVSGVRLIILGQTFLPVKAQWNDTSDLSPVEQERISALKSLEASGALVDYYGLDMREEAAMSVTFEKIRQTTVKLDGIIHSAGVGISGYSLSEQTNSEIDSILGPKIYGTYFLDKYSRELHPDFLVMFSSLNSLVPKRRSAVYAAANGYQDGYCNYSGYQGTKFIGINWPGWSECGMGARGLGGSAPENTGEDVLKHITTGDGIDSFYALLDMGRANTAVAEVDITGFKINPFFSVGNEVVLNPSVSMGLSPSAGEGSGPDEALTISGLSQAESRVHMVWQEILKAETISVDSDFFEMGGHSLNGSQVINRLEKLFEVELEFEDLFEYPTIRSLSAYIEQLQSAGDMTEYSDIAHIPDSVYYDLSHSQKGIWISDQFENAQAAYNIPSAYLLKGILNIDAISRSFEMVVLRYEILRTGFEVVDGEPKQRVKNLLESGFKVEVKDLTNQSFNETQLNKLILEEFWKPFELESTPLLRVNIVRLDHEKNALFFTLHHIISDNWSMDIFIGEVAKYYNEYVAGKILQTTPMRLQYRDFVNWQNSQISNGDSIMRKYWLENMGGVIPVLNLPLDYNRPLRKTIDGSSIIFSLDVELVTKIKKTCKEQEISLFMFLVAGINCLLYKYTGQCDIIVGTPTAGRTHKDLEDQIGLFINTIPLRTRFDPTNDTIEKFLANIKQTILGAFKHQLYPLNKLVNELNITRDLSRSPLFDVMITLYNKESERDQKPQLKDIIIDELKLEIAHSPMELSIDFTENDGSIIAEVQYNTNLFSQKRIGKIESQLKKIIACFTNEVKAKINEINILSAKESVIAGVWARHLGITVESIWVDNDFFELGATDLIASEIISEINQVCDIDLTLGDLKSHPTIFKLCNYIEEIRETDATIVIDTQQLRNYRVDKSTL